MITLWKARRATLISAASCSRREVGNTLVVSKVLSMAYPLQMVSLIHGLPLRPSSLALRDSCFGRAHGSSTVCCRCATANRVLVVSAISL